MTDDARLEVLAALVRRLPDSPLAGVCVHVLRWPRGPVIDHRCRLTVREWREMAVVRVGRVGEN